MLGISLTKDTLKQLAALGLYYGGEWHQPIGGSRRGTVNPATGKILCDVPYALEQDAEAAVMAARRGFQEWRKVHPLERARVLREIANILREHAEELAWIDSMNGGNPVHEMRSDAHWAAKLLDLHAGLVTEMKGASIPMGHDEVNFSVREPLGVIARIVAFNHPLMFSAGRMAAPLAAGNAVIIKPPEQAPLSGIRLAELVGHLLPPGAFGVLLGGVEVGATLSSHAGVDMVTLVGSVPTGRAVYQAGAATIKPVILELGGKNALIACADADPDEVAAAAVKGMNYSWCGQSCGSMSRLLLHADIYEEVLDGIKQRITHYKPGVPTDYATTMGAIVSRKQYDSILQFIESGMAEGARLLCGGKHPDDSALREGTFFDVTPDMRIAQEEIFGPVQSVIRWDDEEEMLNIVNGVEYGLTCAVFSEDINRAHRIAGAVDAGYVWINTVSTHFLGAPFGGVKQSGIGHDECLAELLACTREKNIHIKLRR